MMKLVTIIVSAMMSLTFMGKLDAKYLLVEVEDGLKTDGGPRKAAAKGRAIGGPENTGNQLQTRQATAECAEYADFYEIGSIELPKSIYACKTIEFDLEFFNRRPRRANYIKFTKEGQFTVWLDQVETTYCNPRPEGCSCSELLDGFLQSSSELKSIRLLMDAKPYINGCRCYLGAATRAGFSILNIYYDMTPDSPPEPGCPEETKIDKNNYVEKCKSLETAVELGCGGYWTIRK